MQGACKFGFYEYFKYKIFNALDEYGYNISTIQLPVWLVASGAAEAVASVALCPLEATKIYMQMNPNEASKGIVFCINSYINNQGISSLYKGLPLIMLRQIPYTCVKLSGYEFFSRAVNRFAHHLNSTNPKLKFLLDDKYAVSKQMISGVLAGVLAAFVSQPADVLLSRLCGSSNALTECIIIDGLGSILTAMKSIGLKGCYSGILPRSLMVGTLTALQFSVYETAKQAVSALSYYEVLGERFSKKVSNNHRGSK